MNQVAERTFKKRGSTESFTVLMPATICPEIPAKVLSLDCGPVSLPRIDAITDAELEVAFDDRIELTRKEGSVKLDSIIYDAALEIRGKDEAAARVEKKKQKVTDRLNLEERIALYAQRASLHEHIEDETGECHESMFDDVEIGDLQLSAFADAIDTSF